MTAERPVWLGAYPPAHRRDPLFDQVCVIGEGRPCLAAVISLNPRRWTPAAAELGVDAQAPNAASAATLQRINRLLYDLPGYAQVRAVHLVLEPWTIQQGLLTPTLKIKRQAIQEKYASEIEALYESLREARKGVPAGRGSLAQESLDRARRVDAAEP